MSGMLSKPPISPDELRTRLNELVEQADQLKLYAVAAMIDLAVSQIPTDTKREV